MILAEEIAKCGEWHLDLKSFWIGVGAIIIGALISSAISR